jgi:hypothetical protein
MLKWISCYLSGRHDYQVRCEPGAIYLGCRHCGKRSMGWELQAERGIPAPIPVTSSPASVRAHAHARHAHAHAAR